MLQIEGIRYILWAYTSKQLTDEKKLLTKTWKGYALPFQEVEGNCSLPLPPFSYPSAESKKSNFWGMLCPVLVLVTCGHIKAIPLILYW